MLFRSVGDFLDEVEINCILLEIDVQFYCNLLSPSENDSKILLYHSLSETLFQSFILEKRLKNAKDCLFIKNI